MVLFICIFIQFYHVNADTEKNLMNRLSLKGVPQVLFFQNGKLTGKYAGIRNEEDYREKIDTLL